MSEYHFDEPSRLAADTRRAENRVYHLDHAGHPVPTIEREDARRRLDEARAAEAAWWAACDIGPEQDGRVEVTDPDGRRLVFEVSFDGEILT